MISLLMESVWWVVYFKLQRIFSIWLLNMAIVNKVALWHLKICNWIFSYSYNSLYK